MKPAETSRSYFTCNYYIIGVGSKFLLGMLLLTQLLYGAHSAGPVTDPKEVNVLKILAQKMGVVTIWNFQADPCSSSFQPNVGNNYGGSFLQCNCSYDNGNLCHIIAIAIYRMNLNSQLPADIAGLTYLQFLDLNGNNLNGPIPRELGSLRNLTHLGLGTNRFIGNLPSELGNLELLTDLYVDSNELTGEIPSTLSNLRNLLNLWVFNNNFTGLIPDIFGNLTHLTDLRIYGNKHQGPLPSSLKALKGLLSMYIGDVSLGGGIPLGLSNLKNLTEMSFRNCELTGNIPSELGSLKALTYLDLRFNKLTNEIPITLGRLSLLETLYLGSNNLSGGIPQEFGALNNLRFLDVSYNNLSGSLPQWLSRSNLQEDLIWNFFNTRNFTPNFTTASDNIHVFNCRNFQPYCNRTIVGNYTEFAINVGGPKFKSSASITFDNDNETLGFATFYMSTQERWGISQGGGLGQTNFLDIVNTTTKIQGTTDPILYQTARSSPSSIKYYGLSLLNGFYNIDLHFAEIVLPDDGLGKRVFDVFIQGKRVLKDFNIHASANGSFKALLMKFSAQVTENYLEINFFWSGKGTCCYPRRYSYGPLISAVHVYPASLDGKASQRSSHYIVVIVCIIIGALFLALVAFVGWRITAKKASHLDEKAQNLEMHQRVNLFSYKELYTATKGFQLQNKLGEGGFGVVYKGTLVDGTSVAVKQLAAISRQGDREFLNEVAVISAVQHRNLVQLRGCCLEGNRRLLVYEYLENNSLAQALFGTQIDLNLDWPKRYNIALGTARGLAYLHEESQTRIVHRDIKASNILLDKNLNPKIADFGLARLFEDGKTHISTRIAGTIGYMAPEYAMRGQLTEKADIFSFGIVLLELISGKSNVDLNLPDQCLLLDWAWQLYEENQILNLIDCKLHGRFSEEEAFRLVQVAFLCTQAVPTSRPSMIRVVAMLSGDMVITPLTTKPVFMTDVNITAHPNQRAFSSSSGSHHATIITEVEPR